MKIKAGTLIKTGVSLALLILLIWLFRGKMGEAFQILRTEVRMSYFLLAVLSYFSSICVLGLRFHFTLQVKKIVGSFLNTLYVTFMGIFFSLFLPSAIGGDVMRAVYLSKRARYQADIYSCLVMDRFSGLCVVLVFTFASAALLRESWNPVPAWLGWSALFMTGVAGVTVFVRPEVMPFLFSKMRFLPARFQIKLNLFYASLSGFFHDRPFLIRTLLCSFIGQSLFITSYFLIGKSLDAPIPFIQFFLMVPMITIASMVPSIGGSGPREMGAWILFKMYMSDERAVAMTVLVDVLIYAFGFLGGLWYLIKNVTGDDRATPPAVQNS